MPHFEILPEIEKTSAHERTGIFHGRPSLTRAELSDVQNFASNCTQEGVNSVSEYRAFRVLFVSQAGLVWCRVAIKASTEPRQLPGKVSNEIAFVGKGSASPRN